MKKKGESTLLTNVLITLIVIVAIAIVIAMIFILIKASYFYENAESIGLKIKSAYINPENDSANISIYRSGKGEISFLKFIFKDNSGNNFVYESFDSGSFPNENETKNYQISLYMIPELEDFSKINYVSVVFSVKIDSIEINRTVNSSVSHVKGLEANTDLLINISTNVSVNISGNCTPSCLGKQCGSNGCSGSCGNCSAGYECNLGNCTKIDSIYPIFSNYWDNNGSLVDSGTARFNVSVRNTDGNVFLNINSASYRATNLNSNNYNVSVNMSSGVFNYYWISYGNGTNHNINYSIDRIYIVNGSQICISKNCSALGKQCGNWDDGCNVTINCGNCSSGEICSNGSCVVQNSGLIAYYSFEGNANDETGNGNDGVINGSTLISGKIGQGYSFDGINDYIEVPKEKLNINGPVTISVWIKPSGNMTGIKYYNILAKESIYSSSYGIEIYGSKNWTEFWTRNGTQISSAYWHYVSLTNINDKWTHVVGVYDGTYNKIYINGNLIKTVAGTTPYSSGLYPLRIGYSGNPKIADSYFSGTIDEVKIWNIALSKEEINEEYQRGLGELGTMGLIRRIIRWFKFK